MDIRKTLESEHASNPSSHSNGSSKNTKVPQTGPGGAGSSNSSEKECKYTELENELDLDDLLYVSLNIEIACCLSIILSH